MSTERRLAVSFVLPALNEQRHLERCLTSIQNQNLPPNVGQVDIVVVDNQSADNTVQIAQRMGARVLSVAPGSAARARNAGARSTTADWLAFVDADCELEADWLLKCGRRLGDPNVVAVGAAMSPPRQDAGWVERAWHAIASARAPQEPTDVRWLPTFNMLVRAASFDAVGGFDERLASCEDCEFGYRLAARGRLVLEPAAVTAHHGESQTLRELFRREAWRSQGNIRLARKRAYDVRNWLSVALPVVAVGGAVAAVILAVLGVRHGAAYWVWGAFALGAALLPFALLTARLGRRTSLAMLPRIWLVFAVYLAGRCAGLMYTANRVGRRLPSGI